MNIKSFFLVPAALVAGVGIVQAEEVQAPASLKIAKIVFHQGEFPTEYSKEDTIFQVRKYEVKGNKAEIVLYYKCTFGHESPDYEYDEVIISGAATEADVAKADIKPATITFTEKKGKTYTAIIEGSEWSMHSYKGHDDAPMFEKLNKTKVSITVE